MRLLDKRSLEVVVLEVLLDLGYFGRDDVAVWIFAAVQIVVVLVVLLGRPEFLQRQQMSGHLHLFLLLQLLYHRLRHALLTLVHVENG